MDIDGLIESLKLIKEESHAGGRTPVAVCFADSRGELTENPIYKHANNCSLKKIKLMGSESGTDTYAIVLS